MPPVRLDPFQNIVNVGWGGRFKLLVLLVHFTRSLESIPQFRLRSLGLTEDIIDVFTEDLIKYGIGDGALPDVVNPISDAMVARLRLWNYAAYLPAVSEVGIEGRAIFFFNLTRIAGALAPGATSYSFELTTPATGPTQVVQVPVWWVWSPNFGATTLEENQANPFTTGNPSGIGPDPVTIPIALFSEADANQFVEGVISPTYIIEQRLEDEETADEISWDYLALPYLEERDFPVDAENNPTWFVLATAGTPAADAESGSSEGTPLTARTITFTVSLSTLDVAANKV